MFHPLMFPCPPPPPHASLASCLPSHKGNDLSGTRGLERLGTLQRLVLDGNRIKHVEDGTLGSCPRLAFLYLRSNRLREAAWATAIASLQILILDRNKVGACLCVYVCEWMYGCGVRRRGSGPGGKGWKWIGCGANFKCTP